MADFGKQELKEAVLEALAPFALSVQTDLREIKTDVHDLKTEVREMKTEIQDMKVDVAEVKNRIGLVENELKNFITQARDLFAPSTPKARGLALA
jgi:predicted  nucleic acid-binding Zn-ribbon protein